MFAAISTDVATFLTASHLKCTMHSVSLDEGGMGMAYGGMSVPPRYRPSLQKKGRGPGGSSPLQGNGELHPSPPDALDELLQDLKLTRRSLQVSVRSINSAQSCQQQHEL